MGVERIRQAGQVAWAAVGLAVAVVLLGIVAFYFRVVWPPLILASAIVFILNPVVTFLQRRHIPRALGTALAYLGVVALVGLAALLIAPLAQRQADDLSERWPEIRDDLEEDVNRLAERSEDEDWFVQIPKWDDLGETFGNDDQTFEEQLETARELGLRIFHVAIIFILAPIIAFYLLVDLPHIREVVESLIPASRLGEAHVVGRRLARAIGGFFRGQLVVAFIVGTMVALGLALIELPFWLLIGMIAGLFNMIPLIGPYIGGIPGVVIALTTTEGDGTGKAIAVVLIMVIAQQIDNHFITPNVMQRVVKLHPAAVMLALLAGGTLGGFFGLLLAVPTAAVLKILVGHLWRTYVLGEPIEEIAAVDATADAGGGIVQDVVDDDGGDVGAPAGRPGPGAVGPEPAAAGVGTPPEMSP
jgi:predicted PurR-regulated permease PerM